MFCRRYFGNRMFAPRYFPKIGGTSSFLVAWVLGINRYSGPSSQGPA